MPSFAASICNSALTPAVMLLTLAGRAGDLVGSWLERHLLRREPKRDIPALACACVLPYERGS
jgi:hypothetical protein